ncbi:hypothetical protein [Streptomyces sp. SGAir0957]
MTTQLPAPRITPAVHEAMARRAEQQARDLSVRNSVMTFASGFPGGATPDELKRVRKARDSYARLAAAHRAAARRIERVRRVRRLLGWS